MGETDTPMNEDAPDRPAILVVEDDTDTQTFMKAFLGRQYRVLVASTGEEVREVLNAPDCPVSIILMDLSLKGHEDGLALTRQLRAQARWQKVPIIATTAHAFQEDRTKAMAAGCDGYLTKPFHYQELLEMIDQYLSKKSP